MAEEQTEISEALLLSYLIFSLKFSNLAVSNDFCFDLYNFHEKCLNMTKSFAAISQLSPRILKTFRNVKLGIIVLKKMFFPLQKNVLI